jgi:hypothetical protein
MPADFKYSPWRPVFLEHHAAVGRPKFSLYLRERKLRSR